MAAAARTGAVPTELVPRPQLRHLHVLQGLFDPRVEQARGPPLRSRRAWPRLQDLRGPARYLQGFLLHVARRPGAFLRRVVEGSRQYASRCGLDGLWDAPQRAEHRLLMALAAVDPDRL
jgi:hypothetical protein